MSTHALQGSRPGSQCCRMTDYLLKASAGEDAALLVPSIIDPKGLLRERTQADGCSVLRSDSQAKVGALMHTFWSIWKSVEHARAAA